MSTAESPLSVQHGERLLTCADLAVLPLELPLGPVDFELDNGRLVVVAPPGDQHSEVQLSIASELKIQGEKRRLGKARVEVSIVLWRDPDRVVGADAAFIARRSLPIRRTSEGYLQTIPNLIVEVLSKNDTAAQVELKVADYLKAGVEVVWVLDPETKTVSAHRPGQQVSVLGENDLLQVEDIIPGFRVLVGDLFRDE